MSCILTWLSVSVGSSRSYDHSVSGPTVSRQLGILYRVASPNISSPYTATPNSWQGLIELPQLA